MASLVDHALTTVADVKEILDIDAGDTSKDNLIKRKINQATFIIEGFTGRRFKETVYTDEEYDAPNSNQLRLRQYPILGISGFSSRDTSYNENDWDSVDSSLYFYDTASGLLNLNFNAAGSFNRYKVTYSAGYATIPADIAEAAATLASHLVNNGVSGTGVKSKQEGQRKIEYFDSAANSKSLVDSLGLDEILQPYVNYALGGL